MLKDLKKKEVDGMTILPQANYKPGYLKFFIENNFFNEYNENTKKELFKMNQLKKEQIKNFKKKGEIEDMELGFDSSPKRFDECLYYNIKNENYEQRGDYYFIPTSFLTRNALVIIPTYIIEIIKRIPTYEEFKFLAPSIIKIYETINKDSTVFWE